MEGQLQFPEQLLDNIPRGGALQYLVEELSMKKSLQMMQDDLDKELAQRSGLFLSMIAIAESRYNTSIEPQRLGWLRDVATRFLGVLEAHEAANPRTYEMQLGMMGGRLVELFRIFADQLDQHHRQTLGFDLPAFGTEYLCQTISVRILGVDLMDRDRQGCQEKAWDLGLLPLHLTRRLCDVAVHLHDLVLYDIDIGLESDSVDCDSKSRIEAN